MAEERRNRQVTKRILRMIKKILYILTFLLVSQYAKAQKIHLTDATWQAGVKVFVVDQPYKADLLVYKVEHNWQAKGNKGLWNIVEHRWQADHTVIFVEHSWQADLNIYYCKNQYQAGWKNNQLKSKLD